MADDVKSLLRRARNRVGSSNPLDSYPFISGDAYRLRCNLDLTKPGLQIQMEVNKLDSEDNISIFVGGEKEASILLDFLIRHRYKTNWSLFFHNRDIPPHKGTAERLTKHTKAIYAQGWMENSKSIYPIPSGLENASKRRNGVPRDFLDGINKRTLLRPISVFASFKDSNNVNERINVREIFSHIPDSYCPKKMLSPKQYRKILSLTKFVISPPGNGPDCHRTWESIYMGAIPVVLRKAWPFTQDDLPVLVVDTWAEAVNFISNSAEIFNSEINLRIQVQTLWDKYVTNYFSK